MMHPDHLAFFNACITATTSFEVALKPGPLRDAAISNVERCISHMSDLISEVKTKNPGAKPGVELQPSA